MHFDILDPAGALLFKLFQPSEQYTTYEVRSGEVCVARISKDRGPKAKDMRDVLRFEDAFRVDLESSLLDERDRVILISAALFMDRVSQTGDDQ